MIGICLAALAPVSAAQLAATPIDALSVRRQHGDVIELERGDEATLVFTLANEGNAPLDLVVAAGGGGARGANFRNGSAPPPNGTRSPPPGQGAPPDGFPARGNGTGLPGPSRGVEPTLLTPANLTLSPGDFVEASVRVVVRTDAPGGDLPVTLVVRLRDTQGRANLVATTIRVPFLPAPNEAPPTVAAADESTATVNAETPGPGVITSLAVVAMVAALRSRYARRDR